MIKHFKENLTTDIIWIVAYHTKLSFWIDDIEVEFEKISLYKVEFRIPLFEICYTFPINLDSGSLQIRLF